MGAIVRSGLDLAGLPDDSDELAADLQAIAGPAEGPNGGAIFIDGRQVNTPNLAPPIGNLRSAVSGTPVSIAGRSLVGEPALDLRVRFAF